MIIFYPEMPEYAIEFGLPTAWEYNTEEELLNSGWIRGYRDVEGVSYCGVSSFLDEELYALVVVYNDGAEWELAGYTDQMIFQADWHWHPTRECYVQARRLTE